MGINLVVTIGRLAAYREVAAIWLLFIHLFIQSVIYSFIYLFMCWLIHSFSHLSQYLFIYLSTPFKKVTQHDFDWLYFFYPGFLFIKLRYSWKACIFAFWLMPYVLAMFHWGACRVSKLGTISKRKSYKINRIEWEMHVMSSFGLSFC